MCTTCVRVSERAQEGIRSSETEVTGSCCELSSGFQRERYGGFLKVWVSRSSPQKAVEIWNHGAGVVATGQWELSQLGEEISELRLIHEMRTGRCQASDSIGSF